MTPLELLAERNDNGEFPTLLAIAEAAVGEGVCPSTSVAFGRVMALIHLGRVRVWSVEGCVACLSLPGYAPKGAA